MIDVETVPVGSRRMGSAPWLRRHALDGLVIVLAVFQQAEVWLTTVPGPRLAVMLATALWTLPLLLRHRFRFAAPTFAFAVQIAASFVDPYAFGGEATGLVALLLTFWVVGAENPERQAIAGAAVGCAALAVIAETDARVDAAGAVFVMAMGVSVTAIANTLRRRTVRAAELERRAERLADEQGRRTQAAVAGERTRIARDLHDIIGHSLSVMTVQAGAARLLLGSDPARARESIAAVEDTGRETLAELRRLLGLLHEPAGTETRRPPPGIDQLDALVERERADGRSVRLAVEGTRAALPTGIDRAAYRIVEEALRSALGQPGPAHARVTVRYAPESLQLEIADDRPAVRAAADDSGLLAALRERAGLYGGHLDADECADGDYAVQAWLPLEPSP
jgi:signal transduction histidine kinase